METHPGNEVLAAHALGAVPDDDGERATVDEHVAACATCAAQLREFRLAAAALIDERDADDDTVIDLAALERAWEQVKRRIDS